MTELEELFSLDKALEYIESRDWQSYYRRAISVVRELQSDIEAMDRDRKLIAEKLDEVKENLRTAQNARDALRPQVEDLKKQRDAALAANCKTTTTDQMDTVAQQLSKELQETVIVEYQSEASSGTRKAGEFCVRIWVAGALATSSITAPTLPELAAAVRKWWAERQRKEAANAVS